MSAGVVSLHGPWDSVWFPLLRFAVPGLTMQVFGPHGPRRSPTFSAPSWKGVSEPPFPSREEGISEPTLTGTAVGLKPEDRSS